MTGEGREPGTAGPALSLGQQVRSFVLDKIRSGEWPAGARIPSEAKLVGELGVSRMTIHMALRDLSAEGILLRRQGAGTFVAPRRGPSTFVELRNIHTEIEARGSRHSTDVLLLEQVDSDLQVATELDIAAGAPLFHSLLVHRENGRPIQVEDRYVNPQFAPDYLAQDFTRVTPNEHLTAAGSIDEVEHVIQAVPADQRMRELLELRQGEPVLLLRRRTWSRGLIATSARLYHPGSRFSLVDRTRHARHAPAGGYNYLD